MLLQIQGIALPFCLFIVMLFPFSGPVLAEEESEATDTETSEVTTFAYQVRACIPAASPPTCTRWRTIESGMTKAACRQRDKDTSSTEAQRLTGRVNLNYSGYDRCEEEE